MRFAPITLLALSAGSSALASAVPQLTFIASKINGDVGPRWVDISLADTKFDVRMKRGNTTGFRYTGSTADIARLRVEMWDGVDAESCEPTWTYAIGIHRIVETNGSIPWRASTSFLDLRGDGTGGTWSPFALENTTLSTSAVMSTISTTFTANASISTTGTVTLYAQLSARQGATSTGKTVQPNALKYGIDIADFPYAYVNSTLVLVKAIYSTVGAPTDPHATSVLLGAAGTFTWDSTLDIVSASGAATTGAVASAQVAPADLSGADSFVANNGTDDDGESGSYDGESAALMTFALGGAEAVHARKVSWDPEMTVYAAFAGDPPVSAAGTRFGAPVKALTVAVAAGWLFVLGIVPLF
ncbi:hypothetical protein HDU87_003095 [Geranomyces variabilis]|uniref:Uncharacterized protein n=1 Tax=Geranomyces variabilis TaxID=109894 RepID=A0AAD5TM09_9FUNG|nr:hypothetical protein HDU87_003095 [Geranomyces variabilis]